MINNPDLDRKLSTIQKLERLGKVNIFSDAGPTELLLLAKHCTEEQYAAGQTIFAEGDPANEIVMSVDGHVELIDTHGGSETLGPGQSFGELSVLGDHAHLFSAKAKERLLCLKISRESFWKIIEDHPLICKGIFRVMARRERLSSSPPL